jgi:hypothetical protein
MRALLDRWQPDVVLREPAELASYVASTERGISHVQTSIGLTALDGAALAAGVPRWSCRCSRSTSS